MPDARFTIEHVATQGDTAVFRWAGGATHTGALLRIPPTGRAMRWTGITVVRAAGGRVVQEWGEWDALSVLRQFGTVPTLDATRRNSRCA